MAGAVIFEIQKANFEIAAIQTVTFTKPNAEEFLEVYKGVVHEYPVRYLVSLILIFFKFAILNVFS